MIVHLDEGNGFIVSKLVLQQISHLYIVDYNTQLEMSSRTPTKDRSASKKTPLKSATTKQQSLKQLTTPVKSPPVKSTKKTNVIQDIKQQFLAQFLYDSQFTPKELTQQLKRILAVEGVDTAGKELTQLIRTHNVPQQTIHQALSKLSSQNLSGVIYLFEQIFSQAKSAHQQPTQTNKLQFIDIIDWVNSIWKINPDLVSYSNNLKLSIMNLQQSTFGESLSSIKGKIALITHH